MCHLWTSPSFPFTFAKFIRAMSGDLGIVWYKKGTRERSITIFFACVSKLVVLHLNVISIKAIDGVRVIRYWEVLRREIRFKTHYSK